MLSAVTKMPKGVSSWEAWDQEELEVLLLDITLDPKSQSLGCCYGTCIKLL